MFDVDFAILNLQESFFLGCSGRAFRILQYCFTNGRQAINSSPQLHLRHAMASNCSRSPPKAKPVDIDNCTYHIFTLYSIMWIRDGFKSQPPVDRRLPPVASGWLRSMYMNIHARMTANHQLHAQSTGWI